MENKNLIPNEENDNIGLTPAELIKKHNSDPKHIITDNEMKNLRLGDDAEDEKELNQKIDEKEAEERLRHENNTFDILDV